MRSIGFVVRRGFQWSAGNSWKARSPGTRTPCGLFQAGCGRLLFGAAGLHASVEGAFGLGQISPSALHNPSAPSAISNSRGEALTCQV
jgi:hypothetical protein